MDQVWMIAALWSLVGLAAMVIARWVGGSLRDEIVRVRTQIERRSKTLRLIKGGRWNVAGRPGLSGIRTGLFAVRVGPPMDRVSSSRP